jgi:CheY-like chemotaxis protein
LVVEDDDELREVVVGVLSRADYTVTEAGDGREALARLDDGPPPCLILSDVMMPAMNGLELCLELQQRPALAAVPLVLMTAGGPVVEGLAHEREVPVLHKPLAAGTLLESVSRNCGGPACQAHRAVLIIDDEPAIRETLAQVLLLEGYPVRCEASGIQALSWLVSHRGQAAMVLLDLMMPDMDGESFLAAKEADPALADLPVVLITAWDNSAAAMRHPSVQRCLHKPLRSKTVLEAIRGV